MVEYVTISGGDWNRNIPFSAERTELGGKNIRAAPCVVPEFASQPHISPPRSACQLINEVTVVAKFGVMSQMKRGTRALIVWLQPRQGQPNMSIQSSFRGWRHNLKATPIPLLVMLAAELYLQDEQELIGTNHPEGAYFQWTWHPTCCRSYSIKRPRGMQLNLIKMAACDCGTRLKVSVNHHHDSIPVTIVIQL